MSLLWSLAQGSRSSSKLVSFNFFRSFAGESRRGATTVMAAPFALTYEAPLGPVPDWLSYRVSPTATLVLPFTVETLAPNGAPTAITGQATVTRYETQLLQLPVTVSLVPVPSGQEQISLGSEYTTAGGDGPTIARVVGETELITLGPTTTSPTRGQTQGTAESARSSGESWALEAQF